jgi:hypothetical protein
MRKSIDALAALVADRLGENPLANKAFVHCSRAAIKGEFCSGSPRGYRASATLYSLIESATANGLEPRA